MHFQEQSGFLSPLLNFGMTLTGFFKNLFGRQVKDEPTHETRAAPNYSGPPQFMTDTPDAEAIGVWTSRNDAYWPNQTARAIKHLRNEWASYAKRAGPMRLNC